MKEVWSKGKIKECIVSNVRPKKYYSEESFEAEKEYYGGYLIAQGISDMDKLNIMAASLDMQEALKAAKALFEAQGINAFSRIGGEQYIQVNNAIKKSNGKI